MQGRAIHSKTEGVLVCTPAHRSNISCSHKNAPRRPQTSQLQAVQAPERPGTLLC